MIPVTARAINELHAVGLWFQQPGGRRLVNSRRSQILIEAVGWLNEQGLHRSVDFFLYRRSRYESGDSGSIYFDFDFVDPIAATCFKLRWSSYL